MKESVLTPEEIKTINYYDQSAKEWSEKHWGGTMFDPEMQLLFKLLPKGRILEIGSGHGEDAAKLINHYGIENYIGCEPAKRLLKIAKKKNPKANFINISVYELADLNQKFDGFWISATIIHIPKDKLDKVFKNVHNVIRKGGIGFLSIMEGFADMEESRPGRHYSLWMADEFEKELIGANFNIIKKRRIKTSASPWLTYLLKTV